MQMDHVRLKVFHNATAGAVLSTERGDLSTDQCFAKGKGMNACSFKLADLMAQTLIAIGYDLEDMASRLQRTNEIHAKNFKATNAWPGGVGPD